MRLTLKLTLALTGAILLVLGVNAAIRIDGGLAAFEADAQHDSRLLGRTVAGAASLIYQRVGAKEALELVADANERESDVTIRWVWLDAAAGAPDAPEVPPAVLAAAGGEAAPFIRWRDPGDAGDALYTYSRAKVPDGRPAAVEIKQSLEAEADYVRHTVVQATLATLVLVLVCSAIALGLGAVLVARPVRKLVAQAQRIGAGDLEARLALPQKDEIGALAAAMNAMAARLQTARAELERATEARLVAVEQLRHADRLTTVGKLAAGIAHEVGTPLNVITGFAQLIADESGHDGPIAGHAAVVTQQAHRVAGIVRELLDFARLRPPKKAREDLALIARQVASLLQPMAQKRRAQLVVVAPAVGLTSQVDASQLQQVLTNLVVNAIHATTSDGAARTDPATVTIDLARRHARPPADHGGAEGEWAAITVADAGPGIPADVLPRIFEPFFTTKEPGEGTGLGLSVAYGIVREHGGWLEVETAPGKGTRFAVLLPLDPPEQTA